MNLAIEWDIKPNFDIPYVTLIKGGVSSLYVFIEEYKVLISVWLQMFTKVYVCIIS